jgi:hypothetical protein
MIAFAHNFPDGRPKKSDDLDVMRRFSIDAGQALAILGSGLMALGIFLPFLQHEVLGNPSLWEQAVHHDRVVGMKPLLALAIASCVLACKRWYLGLWLTGFAAYMMHALAFLYSVRVAQSLLSWSPPPNLASIDSVEFASGWYVLVIGIMLLFAGAVVDGILDTKWPSYRRRVAEFDVDFRQRDPWWLTLKHSGGRIGEG